MPNLNIKIYIKNHHIINIIIKTQSDHHIQYIFLVDIRYIFF